MSMHITYLSFWLFLVILAIGLIIGLIVGALIMVVIDLWRIFRSIQFSGVLFSLIFEQLHELQPLLHLTTKERFIQEQDLIIEQEIKNKLQILCDKGLFLLEHIFEEYEVDVEYRVTRRKMSFIKGRPDLAIKHKRLPEIGELTVDHNDQYFVECEAFNNGWRRLEKVLNAFSKIAS
jgi:hypothetical protein